MTFFFVPMTTIVNAPRLNVVVRSYLNKYYYHRYYYSHHRLYSYSHFQFCYCYE